MTSSIPPLPIALREIEREICALRIDSASVSADADGVISIDEIALAPLTSGRSSAAVPVVRPRCPPVWLTRTRPGRALTFSIDGRQYVVPIRALVRVIHGEQAEAEISTPVEDAAQLDDATGRQATLGVWA